MKDKKLREALRKEGVIGFAFGDTTNKPLPGTTLQHVEWRVEKYKNMLIAVIEHLGIDLEDCPSPYRVVEKEGE